MTVQRVYLLLPVGSTCVCSITVHRDWFKKTRKVNNILCKINSKMVCVCLSGCCWCTWSSWAQRETRATGMSVWVCLSGQSYSCLEHVFACSWMFCHVFLIILRKHYFYLRFSGWGDSVIGDKCQINVFKQLWVCLSAQATIRAN